MSGEVYYRDPRAPRDVQGPFPVDRLREFARDGRLRASDQVSLDGQSWLPAPDFEPPLFPEGLPPGASHSQAWKAWVQTAGRAIRTAALATWEHLKRVAKFYWSNRAELRQLVAEYLTFLQDHGDARSCGSRPRIITNMFTSMAIAGRRSCPTAVSFAATKPNANGTASTVACRI